MPSSIPPSWPHYSVDADWLSAADADTLRAAVLRLTARVNVLESEKMALTYAAESFGTLAARLNQSLRAARDMPRC